MHTPVQSETEPDGADAPNTTAGEFDEILYHITHDVRAALRAIQILPSWIRDDMKSRFGEMPEAIGENLDMLETQATRADRFLVDLRTYSRVGRLKDSEASLDWSALIRESACNTGMPESFSIVTNCSIPAIRASKNEVMLLVDALLSNAVKHHDQGQGRIEVSTRKTPSGFCLRVSDDGPGVPAEFHERIFEMMTTLRSRDDCDGSGLGLAIARKIVTNWGGQIGVAPSEGPRGLTVEVNLPADRIAGATVAENVLPLR